MLFTNPFQKPQRLLPFRHCDGAGMKILSWKQGLLYLRNLGPLHITDRYGGRTPSWIRGCHGPCESMGYYPESDPSKWPEGTRPLGVPTEDGYPCIGFRFLKCPDCKGTGRISWVKAICRIPSWIIKGFRNFKQFTHPDMYGNPTPSIFKRIWDWFLRIWRFIMSILQN